MLVCLIGLGGLRPIIDEPPPNAKQGHEILNIILRTSGSKVEMTKSLAFAVIANRTRGPDIMALLSQEFDLRIKVTDALVLQTIS